MCSLRGSLSLALSVASQAGPSFLPNQPTSSNNTASNASPGND
jgi:hypothetical protein